MAQFEFEYEKNGKTQTFSFDGDSIVIGRAQSADFVVDHKTVSREHARIDSGPNGNFRLVVLSRGGLTAVDGQRVNGQVPLYDGQKLHFGKLSFRFRSEFAPPKPRSGRAQSSTGEGRPTTGSASTASSAGGASSAPGGADGWEEYAEEGGGATGADDEAQTDGSVGEESDGAQVFSWDDIADSAGDDGEDSGGDDDEFEPSSISRKKGDDEETNPIFVGVASVAIIGLLIFIMMPKDKNTDGREKAEEELNRSQPVRIEVDCLSEPECLKKAKRDYEIGLAKLERKEAQIENLFVGYKHLLKVEKYLEEGGVEAPSEMQELQPKIEEARAELDRIFKNYRVKHDQARRSKNYRAMASALQTIQRYFPDKTAREYRWAREQILQMKDQGIFPKDM